MQRDMNALEKKLSRVEEMISRCEQLVEGEQDEELRQEILEEEGYFQMKKKKDKLEKMIANLKNGKTATTSTSSATVVFSTTLSSSPSSPIASSGVQSNGSLSKDGAEGLPAVFQGLGLNGSGDTIKCTNEQLNQLSGLVASAGLPNQQQLDSMVALRKVLSVERDPPTTAVLNADIMRVLVGVTSQQGKLSDRMQHEIGWIITNLASGSASDTKRVVEGGGLGILLDFLQTGNSDAKEQAVWGLGNIAGDSPGFRDQVIRTGAVTSIIECLNEHKVRPTVLRNCVWALSNMCRGKPQPDFKAVEPILDLMPDLLESRDSEVLGDALWALSYLSDDTGSSNEKIGSVVKKGIVKPVVKLLHHKSTAIVTPALRCVGNIVSGDDVHTEEVVNAGGLTSLLSLLRSSQKTTIQKEVCWALSNITAGNATQIGAFINAGGLQAIMTVLTSGMRFEVQKEALWALSNMTSGGTPAHLRQAIKQGIVPVLCSKLNVSDPQVLLVILEGLENLLRIGLQKPPNLVANMVEQSGGLDFIESLQSHSSNQVYTKAASILQTYFAAEDVDDDDAPALSQAAQNSQQNTSVPGTGFGTAFGFS
mmetsp:Transcript_14941/g.22613  ORF Transcript_14941/g.22613 Transcript_14941/m.22613 type:complete len:593 (+) Transcript_14941:64-1842(+)|eukprot:CAMPEP_0167752006 /NCGR_PEP_ID=MMETSP0110_2-20121227/6893_1 /TAXON_ID=629695 /ORGANISM="Gymnochlora sp., Strain CCMP2014" /LENGTH=592 /DNA_ID=CAMNT_0007637563 /DNA_START=62 /DNA_END=1840 /DNA_ORIENTATION=-